MQANTARVVFSWNDNDPANDDPDSGPMYHGSNNRGSASLNLLGGLINMPPEPQAGTTGSFNITVNNVSLKILNIKLAVNNELISTVGLRSPIITSLVSVIP